MELYENLWAKSSPYKQLISHMIDAGACAHAFLSAPSSASVLRFLTEQWVCSDRAALSFASYLVALHDIGKASPSFQSQSEQEKERLSSTPIAPLLHGESERVRHEYHSAFAMSRIWKAKGQPRKLIKMYSKVLSLHHQRPERKENEARCKHGEWYDLQTQIERKIANLFEAPQNLFASGNANACCMLLSALTVLCDWIASSGAFDDLGLFSPDYLSKSMAIADAVVYEYGVAAKQLFPETTDFSSMWPAIRQPRAVQKACEELCPQAKMTIIEAPMGEGKTEAALYLAGRLCSAKGKRGVYVALPTQATSNQMVGRVSKMLDSIHGGQARLLHGMAQLVQDQTIQSEDQEQAQKWLRPLRMGLLGDSAVGTVDQAMAGVLLAKFGMLRILGLVNKVLVIDELHAYDAYMSEIIARLLQWCKVLDIPVILLSATLQSSQKKKYIGCFTDRQIDLPDAYPLITQVGADGTMTTIKTEASLTSLYQFEPDKYGSDAQLIAARAISLTEHGGCVCVLMNTVKAAQEVYRILQAKLGDLGLLAGDVTTLLFHARFTVGRRNEIEQQCLRLFGRDAGDHRPNRAILVATQVVEQSLDLDFDTMISELAPIDLLLQRAGRVHRHRERKRPEGLEEPVIHVLVPNETASEDANERYGLSVYDSFLLYNTEQLLGKGVSVSVPKDVRGVIGQVYDHISPQAEKAWVERAFDAQIKQANAKSIIWDEPDPDVFFPAQSSPFFSPIETDDGYEPALRATTRLGEPTMRIAFCTEEQQEAAREGHLTKEQSRQILLQSVNLRRESTDSELEQAPLYHIEKGPLRGCFVTDNPREVRIGDKRLINDPILGVK